MDDATVLESLQARLSRDIVVNTCAVTKTHSQSGSKAGICFLLFWGLGSPSSIVLAILLLGKSSCPDS